MKTIKLQSLSLKDFKGVENFTLELNGKNADIFGKNATGKSTLFDSSQWLLFGKDSSGRADYQIKPQDEDGNEIHRLDCIVEGVFLVDNNKLKLKRQLSEKWVKKQGTQVKEFTGNETKYWVNDVPVKAKDYTLEINMLIKENIFKLLTNPLFFNTNEKGFGWQERRKILFEICGDVSDSDVIDSLVSVGDKSMLDLQMVINSGRTIEQHKLVVSEKIKSTKSQMDGIPSRINEQQRNITEDVTDYTAIETSLQAHRDTLQAIELELATNAKGASLYRQKQQQAYKLQGELDARKKDLDNYSLSGLKKAIEEKSQLEGERYLISTEVKKLGSNSELRSMELENIEKLIIELRKTWAEENAKQFIAPDGFSCPTCEQSLPEGKAQEKIDKLKENFDKNKNQVISGVRKQGTDAGSRAEFLNKEKTLDAEILTKHETRLTQIYERIVELENDIEREKTEHGNGYNYSLDLKYSSLTDELQALQVELDKPIEDTTSDLLYKKQETASLIEWLNRTLNQKEVIEKAKLRIEELKAEESKLAAEINSYERQDYLIKQFTTAKVKILEDSINNRFKTVKFKLFDTLNDGTEKEVCRTLVNTNGVWVEFDGANNGGKIIAGLSIIEMLSEFYGVSCPIFIDNFESITGTVDVNSQVIKLIVSAEDEKLRVVGNKA